MADLDLARQLVAYVDETTTPVTHTDPRPTEMIMLTPHRNEPSRPIWMAAAAAAAVVAVGTLVFAAIRGDNAERAEDPPPPTTEVVTPDATLPIGPREQSAVDAAEAFFAAWSQGDVDTVIAASDLAVTNAEADSEAARWWSGASWPDGDQGGWPSADCRAVESGADTVLVECPVAVNDPVAVALGVDELLWSADVADDGTIRRRAEPLTSSLRTYAPVWSAYADYLSMSRPDDYAASCDPARYPNGEIFDVSGLALTGKCAELTSAVALDVATWIADDRPELALDGQATVSSTDTSADEPVAVAANELLTAEALFGYWTNVGGRTSGGTALLVDFRRDGTFTIGNTGRLGDGAFAGGTYAVVDDTIVFTGVGGGCDGETFGWTRSAFGDGRLDVDVTPNDGCAPDAGWNWVRVSPESTAGLEIAPGSLGATQAVPESVRNVVGIWLRLGSGEVVAIDADGSYLMTTNGDTVAPTDSGRVTVESPGIIAFTSDGTGDCTTGEAWTWTDVTTAADVAREGNPRGTTMRTASSGTCGSADQGTVWRLLSPDLVGV